MQVWEEIAFSEKPNSENGHAWHTHQDQQIWTYQQDSSNQMMYNFFLLV